MRLLLIDFLLPLSLSLLPTVWQAQVWKELHRNPVVSEIRWWDHLSSWTDSFPRKLLWMLQHRAEPVPLAAENAALPGCAAVQCLKKIFFKLSEQAETVWRWCRFSYTCIDFSHAERSELKSIQSRKAQCRAALNSWLGRSGCYPQGSVQLCNLCAGSDSLKVIFQHKQQEKKQNWITHPLVLWGRWVIN